MAKKSKELQILEAARLAGKQARSWIDLHNAVFGLGGIATRMLPTQQDRTAFAKTPAFKAITEMIDELRGDGPDEEHLGRANGAISVRVPTSIHAALLAEAKAEGVSLNQLCLAKLAVQLRAAVV